MDPAILRDDRKVSSHEGAEPLLSTSTDSSEYLRLADWIELLDRVRETCSSIQQKMRTHADVDMVHDLSVLER